MANGLLRFTLRDYSQETSGVTINTGAVTAISLPGLLTQIGALRTAIDGMTLGVLATESLKVFETNLSPLSPTDENAQRERKWLVRYADVTPFFDDPINAIPNEAFGNVYTLSIPTALLAGTLQAGSDYADLADPLISPFVTAFEAIARTPAGGAVDVLSIQSVGRNI